MTATFLTGDALAMMATLPDGSIDAVICDPPYESTKNPWDSIIPIEPMWKEIWRLCRGAVVFTAMQPFSSTLVTSQVKRFRHEWVWEKNKATGHLNAKKMPMRAHELVLVFAAGRFTYQPQMTTDHAPMNSYVQTSNGSNYGATKRPSGGGSTQRYPRSVQKFSVVNNDDPEKAHPTQKPVELFEYLIKTYSREGDTVLDFSMGSGTTGVACRRTGRNFIGIELDEKYAAIARGRIENDAGPLFAGAA